MAIVETGYGKVNRAPLRVALAWLVVVLPAAWGVYNTVLRAANLFKH